MILVIAEKPSVGAAIGKVLGASSRKDGYLEGNNYIVSWCVGHHPPDRRPQSGSLPGEYVTVVAERGFHLRNIKIDTVERIFR